MNPYKRTCRVCKTEYTLSEEEVDWLLSIGLAHPFLSCKACSGLEQGQMEKVIWNEVKSILADKENRTQYLIEIYKEFGREIPDELQDELQVPS